MDEMPAPQPGDGRPEPDGAAVPVGAAVPDGVDGVGSGPPPRSDGSPAQLARLVGVLRAMDRLAARAVALVQQVDARAAVADEGLTLDTAVQLYTGWTRGDISMLLTARDVLGRLPTVTRLFESGVLSWGQVRILVAGARRFDAATLAALDTHLADHELQLRQLEPEQRTWVIQDTIDEHTATRTLTARDERAVEADRLVLCPKLDGSGDGFFELHPEAFTTVADRLQTEADAPQAAASPMTDDSDHPPTQEPVPRSRQLADALVRLCARHDDDGPLAAVRATVVIDTAQLSDRFAGELRSSLATRPPRVVRRAIDRITCDSAMDVVVRDGVDLLAAKRDRPEVTADIRRAVAARDGGCRFPGCRAPVAWCDVHHVHERSRGSDHGLANLVLLCRRHHTIIHRRGWKQHLSTDGGYRITRNGRTWTTLPRLDQQLPPPDRPTRAGPAPPGDVPDDVPF